MKRRICCMVLALVMAIGALSGLAALAQGEYLGTMTVVNCDEWVSLRSRPSTSASRITKVPYGARVEAYYYNAEYCECYYNGQWGYILSTYLSNGNGSTGSSYGADYLGKRVIDYCNEFVTLRSDPSTSASAVTRVAKGEVVDCYYYNNTFTYCYYNGMTGYILNQYLAAYDPYDVNYNEPYYTAGYATVINCEEWVSLRARPDKNSTQLAKVPKGARVEAYYYNTEFAECYYNGQWGYILSTYLSNVNGSGSTASYGSNYLGKRTVANVNEFVTLRSEPSTSSDPVTRISKGEVVDAYYYNDQFAYCYYNGLGGYVLTKYLR